MREGIQYNIFIQVYGFQYVETTRMMRTAARHGMLPARHGPTFATINVEQSHIYYTVYYTILYYTRGGGNTSCCANERALEDYR